VHSQSRYPTRTWCRARAWQQQCKLAQTYMCRFDVFDGLMPCITDRLRTINRTLLVKPRANNWEWGLMITRGGENIHLGNSVNRLGTNASAAHGCKASCIMVLPQRLRCRPRRRNSRGLCAWASYELTTRNTVGG